MYYFTAESMTRSQLEDIKQTVEDDGIGIVVAGTMSSVFTGLGQMVIDCDRSRVEEIQALIHAVNGGAYCGAVHIKHIEHLN